MRKIPALAHIVYLAAAKALRRSGANAGKSPARGVSAARALPRRGRAQSIVVRRRTSQARDDPRAGVRRVLRGSNV
jgi:hypothetical protein